MKRSINLKYLPLALAALAVGCATRYSWKPTVPQEFRTVAVPTLRNESDLTEAGSVAARQLLREFQREGTFTIATVDEAAVEVQGVVKEVSLGGIAYNRRSSLRMVAHEIKAKVEISVIDRKNGRVLIENRIYEPVATVSSSQDYDTAKRDACGRLMDDLSRLVVDDVLNLKW